MNDQNKTNNFFIKNGSDGVGDKISYTNQHIAVGDVFEIDNKFANLEVPKNIESN